MGKLFIVPTPIGNMADMTPRAVEVLRSVNRIYAEDTRTSSVLLRHFDISTPCSSFHKFNEHQTVRSIIDLLLADERIALISDAGTPGISDPGFLLTRECRNEGIEVETLPGATAFVPALVNSGLPCERFTFEGFLPAKKGRQTRLERIASSDITSIIYESPLRLVKTLEQLAAVCGPGRQASVSREISKIHNETVNGTLEEIISHYSQNNPKGECVIIVNALEESKGKIHKNKYKAED